MKSIMPDDQEDTCYLCSRRGKMEVHHCLHGPYRKKADRYGLTVHLCPKCHRALHDKGTDDRLLEELAQQIFENEYGHDLFIREFGKNWL